jgi:prolyl 4-hydroxylase
MRGRSVANEVQQHISSGQFAKAAALLRAGAAAGDAESRFILAAWRISGQIVRRDVVAARLLMGKAAEAGHSEAALLHAHFLANGTGGSPDWKSARAVLERIADDHPRAAEQLGMLARMAVGEDGEPTFLPELKPLSDTPAIFSTAEFLTADESAYLVQRAEPRLQPSLVTERATGRLVADPVRRSEGTFFGVAEEDLVVNAINRRIAAVTATQVNQAEPLQVLRYRRGGEFRPHHDAIEGVGNQRVLTALAYLSDGYEGGDTRFMRTGFAFRGRRGDLLMFRNVTPSGQLDPLAEHAGMPVHGGTKIVASRWIWREPPHFPPPAPLLPDVDPRA